MYLYCSGVIAENSAICAFVLSIYGNSVVLVTLIASYLSIIIDIEWEISRLAVSAHFPNGFTVPVVFHSEGWSIKAVIVFVVSGGIVSENRLGVCCCFNLYPQMWEMYEAVCCVNEHTVVRHKVQPYEWPC